MTNMVGKVVVVKLGSGHSIVGQLEKDKWTKIRIYRPFAIERRMDAEGNLADVLVPYVPYIKDTGIWINKKAIVSYYEVNSVFTNFYESTLNSFMKTDVFMADKAVQDFLDDEKEELDLEENLVKEGSWIGPTSNTIH